MDSAPHRFEKYDGGMDHGPIGLHWLEVCSSKGTGLVWINKIFEINGT